MSQSGTPAANLAMDQAGQNTPLGETTPEQQTFYPSSMAGALLGEQIVGTPRGGNIGTFPQPTNRPPAGHKTLSGGQNYERLQQQRQQLLGGQQTGGSTSTVDMQDQQGGGSQQDQQGSAGFYGRSGRGMSNLGRPQSATAPLFGGSNAGGLARSGSSFPRQQSLFGGAQSQQQQQQSSLQALRQELAHLREMVHQLTGGAAGANGQMMMGGSRLSRSLTALPAFGGSQAGGAFGGSQAGGVSAYRANYRDGGYGSTGYANYRAGYAQPYADAYADQQYGQYAQQDAPWGEDAAQGAYDYAYPDDEDDYACGDGMYREQMRANQYAGQGYRAGNQYGGQGYRAGYRAGGSVSTMGGFRAQMGQGYRAGSY